MKYNEVLKLLKNNGADLVGVCKVSDYNSYLSELDTKYKPIVDYKSLVTIGFTYNKDVTHSGFGFGRVSSYCNNMDYHIVLKEFFEKLKQDNILQNNFEYRVDSVDIYDRLCAYLSGFGFYGKNHFIINEEFGTYYFIGIMLFKEELDQYSKVKKGSCDDCDRCLKACPTKCLDDSDFNNCLSHITESKKVIDKKTLKILKHNIFGCDLCQQSCPYNNVKHEKNACFNPTGIENIDIRELYLHTNKTFESKYKKCAFTYKGKLVLQRNALGVVLNEGISNYYNELKVLLDKNKNIKWFYDTLKPLLEEYENEN